MHWLYPQLQNVFHTLANILKRNLDPGPLAALFGITDEDDPHQTFAERCMVASASLLARRAVFLKRKDAARPRLSQWL